MSSEQIIELYKQGLGAPAIAKKLQTTNYFVYKALLQAGIKPRSHKEKSTKYQCNHKYFNSIKTEAQAYWLGFLAADGYQSKGYVGCSLALKDKHHLEKLKQALQAEHPLGHYRSSGYSNTEYVRLLIRSDELCADLQQLGVTKRKTFSLKFPALAPKLVPHFIRGYFDGDGCWARSKKSASGFTMKICGNKTFLEELAKHLGLAAQRVHKHKSIYCLEKSGKSVLCLMNYMYDDANIYLERKQERWAVAQSLLDESSVE